MVTNTITKANTNITDSVDKDSLSECEKKILRTLLENETVTETELLYLNQVTAGFDAVAVSNQTEYTDVIQSLKERQLITLTDTDSFFSLTPSSYTLSLTEYGHSIALQVVKQLILDGELEIDEVSYEFTDEFIHQVFCTKI